MRMVDLIIALITIIVISLAAWGIASLLVWWWMNREWKGPP